METYSFKHVPTDNAPLKLTVDLETSDLTKYQIAQWDNAKFMLSICRMLVNCHKSILALVHGRKKISCFAKSAETETQTQINNLSYQTNTNFHQVYQCTAKNFYCERKALRVLPHPVPTTI